MIAVSSRIVRLGVVTLPKTYEDVEDEIIKRGKGFASFKRMIGEMIRQRKQSRNLAVSIIITAVTGTIYPLTLGLAVDAIIDRNALLLVADARVCKQYIFHHSPAEHERILQYGCYQFSV